MSSFSALRPSFHFTAQKNWINDPNGLVYFNGLYHLFYQHHPHSKKWGPMHWGHAVSADLFHWKHLPIALCPSGLGPIFSGSCVYDRLNTSGLFNDKGGVVAVFTQAERPNILPDQKQSIAYSSCGEVFTMFKGNPVIPNSAVNEQHFRDPKVFWHAPINKWVMVVAGGRVRIYTSENLIDWTLTQCTDILSECPDLFPLQACDGEKWVLTLSSKGYIVGDFNGTEFIPTQPRREIYGPDLYAGQTFNNLPDSRRISISWMADLAHIGSYENAFDPFMGVLSLPVEYGLIKRGEEYILTQTPVKELALLYHGEPITKSLAVSKGSAPLPSLSCFDLTAEVKMSDDCTDAGIILKLGGGNQTKIGVKPFEGVVYLDRTQAGGDASGYKTVTRAPLAVNGSVKMRVIADNGTVDVFFNDGEQSLYSLNLTAPQHNAIALFSTANATADITLHEIKL